MYRERKGACAKIIYITFNSSTTYPLYTHVNFKIKYDREGKDVPRSNMQFFHNLPAINFRRHDREKKICWDHLYNIQFFHKLPAINSKTWQRKMCWDHSYVTFDSSTTYRLYKFQNETWHAEKEKMCQDHLYNIQFFTTCPLYKNFKMRQDRESKTWQRKICWNHSYITFDSSTTYCL